MGRQELALASIGGRERQEQAGRSILIVNGRTLARQGLALKVTRLVPDATVEEVESLTDALATARKGRRFELVLIDRSIAIDRSGDDLGELTSAMPGTPVLVLAASDDASAIRAGIRKGACGYILDGRPPAVFEHAIRLILADGAYLPLPRALLEESPQSWSAGPRDIPARLTGRQRDVYDLLLAGRSNKEIARALGVLEGTVKVHVRAIMQKLGASNRTQVAVLAAREGLPASGVVVQDEQTIAQPVRGA